MKKAHIISIGNELLIGDTVNTNATWLGSVLTGWGFTVEQVLTIQDDYALIKKFVKQSVTEADITIITGGLGPTHDDITKKAVADLFEAKMVENEEVLRHVKSIFERRKFKFSSANAEQAMVPENCEVLFNKEGTAPGMWFNNDGHILIVLPGVPYEMKYLMNREAGPKIAETFPNLDIWATEYFKTAGIPESTLSEKIGDLDEFVNNGVGIAYLPNPNGVTIRISASGSDMNEAQAKLGKLHQVIFEKAGDAIYGQGKDLELAEVVGKILTKKKLTIATAESCTGGLISSKITDIAGSSTYLMGGVVSYSNGSKIRDLNVSKKDLSEHGAVSKPVALQMAKGVAERFGTDIGVSATGIAGPGGGTSGKPVGTVWMGFWISGDHFALKTVFTNDRLINKRRTVMVVLETLRRRLLGIKSLPYNLKANYN